jgi:hypothetical protein
MQSVSLTLLPAD